MAEEPTRRVELVAEADDAKREAGRTGLGLVIGLVFGRNSLIAAATGTEQFEFAIAHFVGLVLASVGGMLLLGALYDRASRHAAKAETALLEATDSEPEDSPTSPELPIGMPT